MHIKNIVFMLILVFILSGCIEKTVSDNKPENFSKDNPVAQDSKNPETKNQHQEITAKEAKKKLVSEKDIYLVDVRTPEEHAEKRIPNSLLIPLDVIEKEIEKKIPDKDAQIIVYCRSGRRSLEAALIMTSLGYKHIFDLGGIQDWPYETESDK